MRRAWQLIAAGLVLAACAPRAADVESGSYQLLKVALSLELDVTDLGMAVDRDDERLQIDGVGQFDLEWSSERFRVCPGGTAQRVLLLVGSAPLSLPGAVFNRPALRGQCGKGLPRRVALVDLSVRDDQSAVAYPRWIEWCRLEDLGCPGVR